MWYAAADRDDAGKRPHDRFEPSLIVNVAGGDQVASGMIVDSAN
jgi:hypothetical protein